MIGAFTSKIYYQMRKLSLRTEDSQNVTLIMHLPFENMQEMEIKKRDYLT